MIRDFIRIWYFYCFWFRLVIRFHDFWVVSKFGFVIRGFIVKILKIRIRDPVIFIYKPNDTEDYAVRPIRISRYCNSWASRLGDLDTKIVNLMLLLWPFEHKKNAVHEKKKHAHRDSGVMAFLLWLENRLMKSDFWGIIQMESLAFWVSRSWDHGYPRI